MNLDLVYRKQMKNKSFEVILNEKNPELLIITPLSKRSKIDAACMESIFSQDVKKVWTRYKSKNSASFNRLEGYKKTKNFLRKKLPPFILFCDNDIVWRKKSFRNMISQLKKTDDKVGYVYCGFEYKEYRNISFPVKKFDPNCTRNFCFNIN